MTANAPKPDRESEHLSARLNWLRAGVLGSNDGIISTAGIVFGVAGATTQTQAILIAGLAGLIAGALSMAGGEYVSVSSQRDTELSASRRTRSLFEADPLARRAKLAQDYVAKGVDPRTAEQFVAELRDSDVEANALSSLGIDADRPVSPWVAAGASFVSFTIGALIPLLAMAFTPPGLRLSVTVAAVVAALVITGFAAARLSSVPVLRPIVRNVVVGMAAMNVTYLAGSLFQLTL